MSRVYSMASGPARDRPPHAGHPKIEPAAMPPRRRKLIATLVLLAGLSGYVLGAIVLADLLPSHWALDLAFFAVAGVAWAFPTMVLLRWAEGADPNTKASSPPETRP